MTKNSYDVRSLGLTVMFALLFSFLWYYMPENLGLIKDVFLFLVAIAGINIVRVARKVLM
jgi:hypothetical protein